MGIRKGLTVVKGDLIDAYAKLQGLTQQYRHGNGYKPPIEVPEIATQIGADPAMKLAMGFAGKYMAEPVFVDPSMMIIHSDTETPPKIETDVRALNKLLYGDHETKLEVETREIEVDNKPPSEDVFSDEFAHVGWS